MIRRARIISDTSGAAGAEFTLLLPVFLVLIFGIIDGGRWLWIYNQAEKATQAGARVAVVTAIIPGGLSETFVGKTIGGTTLTQGDRIPADALATVSCTKASGAVSCDCPDCSGVTLTPINETGWNAIVARMRAMYPEVSDDKVVVRYRGSGLGFAGDPNGVDIAPLITVELQEMRFKPITAMMLATFDMPSFSTTLTSEDLSGTQSN